MNNIQIGDKIEMYFGIEKILAIRKYIGVYPEYFDCIITVTAPRTQKGSVEFAVDSTDLRIRR